MEHTLKKSLITVFKKFIQHLENGYCDNLSDEQYNEMLKAFLVLNKIEKEINDSYEKMSTASEDEINKLLEEVGELQEILEHQDFYLIDSKVEEIANGMGINKIGLDKKGLMLRYK